MKKELNIKYILVTSIKFNNSRGSGNCYDFLLPLVLLYYCLYFFIVTISVAYPFALHNPATRMRRLIWETKFSKLVIFRVFYLEP